MRTKRSRTAALVAAGVVTVVLAGCWPYDSRMESALGGSAADSRTSGLSDAEVATLVWMVEEEKLAHDVYVVLGRQYDMPIFTNIAESETRHHDAVAGLLDTYGVDDPSADTGLGEFDDPTLQTLYDRLVAQGGQSLADAFAVGVLIEQADITDLQAAIEESTHADIDQVYGNLLEGSRQHLEAFSSH